jgi:hypothetical protein
VLPDAMQENCRPTAPHLRGPPDAAAPRDRRPDRRRLAGLLLAAALSTGAAEDAYRAGYLAGIRTQAQMGQLLPGDRRSPREPG